MLNALTRAISDSPYSAIVQHTKVAVQRDGKNGDKHIRHARVLETLRGPKMDKITYTMFTEPGESAKPPRGPVIITLCHDADGFYWPGVGSSFPNGKDAAGAAKIAAASAKQDQTVFPNCDCSRHAPVVEPAMRGEPALGYAVGNPHRDSSSASRANSRAASNMRHLHDHLRPRRPDGILMTHHAA